MKEKTTLKSHAQSGAATMPARRSKAAANKNKVKVLLDTVLQSLEDSKAEEIIVVDIETKSSIGDYMVIASGRSHRHVGAAADHLLRDLKEKGFRSIKVEGMPACDWVLIDAGDVIVHVFRPEVREFYNLEKMWMTADSDADKA